MSPSIDQPKTPRKADAALLAAVALLVVLALGVKLLPHSARSDTHEAMRSARTEIDPSLLRYRENGRIPIAMTAPRGIAAGPNGMMIVVGDRAVQVISPDGRSRQTINLQEEPTCVSSDGQGTLYIGHRQGVVRVRLKSMHAVTPFITLPKSAYVTSLAVSKHHIWVADAGRRIVQRYALDGVADGQPLSGFQVPSPHFDIATGAGGAFWVVDPGRVKLKEYLPDGTLRRAWGTHGFDIDAFSGCCNPTDVALLPDGRIVTSEKGTARVKVYRPDGTLESVVAGEDAFAQGVSGLDLAVDGQGRILVLDPATKVIRIYEDTRTQTDN